MAMLEIRNVQKTFRTYTKPGLFHRPGARKVISGLPVLRGVDLTVEKGDVVAIWAVRFRQDHPAAVPELFGDCRCRAADI